MLAAMGPADLEEGSLLDLLLADDTRATLVAAMPGDRALAQRFDAVVRGCHATADQLRRLAVITAREGRDELLEPLVAHPAMPREVLEQMCAEGRCISALGHLAGPRSLLRQIVAEHGYREAILSLGLDLYADPTVPPEEFADLLRAHCDHEPLLRALAYGRPSHPAKEDLVLALCAQHPARDALQAVRATVQAIARAADPTVAPAEIAALLASGEPRVLAALAGNPRTPTPALEALATSRGFPHAQTIRGRAVAALRARRRAR